MFSIRRAVLFATVVSLALWGRWLAIFSRGSVATAPAATLARVIEHIERGYTLDVLREMPEKITALTSAGPETPELMGKVYAGTSPVGAVYCFNVLNISTYVTIGEGLGDYIRYGICDVNSLAIRDLDCDGTPELLATTSQIVPNGRPRLYVWSLSHPNVLRSMVRPDIRSSWSHGIGFLDPPGAATRSTFVSFCGFGEIVEYRLDGGTDDSGFAADSLRWKKVAQLPASGEWLQSADVDQDGATELCVATGYVPGKAAIQIYAGGPPGSDLRLERVIDEGGRFFNVRFVVGDPRGDGAREVVAWWRLEDDKGDCEVVGYQIGPEGIRGRTLLAQGAAGLLWPCDGQMAVMDLDGNGHREVWFSTYAGSLWCLDASRAPAPTLQRVVKIHGEFGPITPAPPTLSTPPALLVAHDRSVLRLVRTPSAGTP